MQKITMSYLEEVCVSGKQHFDQSSNVPNGYQGLSLARYYLEYFRYKSPRKLCVLTTFELTAPLRFPLNQN